ncbi:MAG: bile acid:sodium symporter family protein [Alphaproteobacteria bacterium]
MTGHLQQAADLSIPAFVVSTMLAAGMSQPLADVVAPLRRPLPVVLALLVNFAFAPLLAIVLTSVVPLQPAHATGILLLGAAAGAPFMPKLAEISLGSIAYSVALMVLLMGGSIVFMPLALPLMIPGLSADPWAIARPLLVVMVLPLSVGFALGLSRAPWAARLLSVVRTISSATMLLLVVLMIGLNFKTLLSTLGSFAIGTYMLYLFVVIGVSYLIGAIDPQTQNVFALGAGSRNIPACLVIAGSSLGDPAVTVMLIVAFVISLVGLLALAKVMRPRAPAGVAL